MLLPEIVFKFFPLLGRSVVDLLGVGVEVFRGRVCFHFRKSFESKLFDGQDVIVHPLLVLLPGNCGQTVRPAESPQGAIPLVVAVTAGVEGGRNLGIS